MEFLKLSDHGDVLARVPVIVCECIQCVYTLVALAVCVEFATRLQLTYFFVHGFPVHIINVAGESVSDVVNMVDSGIHERELAQSLPLGPPLVVDLRRERILDVNINLK